MAATYEPIASATVSTSGSSITLNSGGIFANYTDLVIALNGKCYYPAGNTALIRFNGDSNSNYSNTYLIGDGSSASSTRVTDYSYMFAGGFALPSQSPSMAIYHIMQVNNTSVHKTVLIESAHANDRVERLVGLWRSTNAITSILVGNNYGWETGTTVSLYGIKAA